MTNRFIILNSVISNLNQTIFIINRTHISENWNSYEEPLKNVKFVGQ